MAFEVEAELSLGARSSTVEGGVSATLWSRPERVVSLDFRCSLLEEPRRRLVGLIPLSCATTVRRLVSRSPAAMHDWSARQRCASFTHVARGIRAGRGL